MRPVRFLRSGASRNDPLTPLGQNIRCNLRASELNIDYGGQHRGPISSQRSGRRSAPRRLCERRVLPAC